MKYLWFPAWLVAGVSLFAARLAAQDVIVTDPAWLDQESPPADVVPTFKKRPKPEVPDEIAKGGVLAYALVYDTLDDSGKRTLAQRECTNPYLEAEISRATAMDAIKFTPAKRDGKAVETTCWYAFIFNPRSAAEGKADATARVLEVAPVVVKKKDLPPETKLPLVIWATLAIDEKGRLQNYNFEETCYESLRPQVGGALHVWEFAPARKDGKAVASELKVPLILNQPYAPKAKGVKAMPLKRVQPLYPVEMKRTGLRGDVLVEFVVDKKGAVKDPVVVRSNNPGFNEAAIEAVLQWKFEPARVGGLPMMIRMQQPFQFDINGPMGTGRDLMTVENNKKAQEKLPEALRYDIAPKPKGVLAPVFPHNLLLEKKSGKASLAFVVNERGNVSEVKVIEASHPEFGLAMTAAVEAFTFIPAMRGGRPTSTILRMEQKFSVSGADQAVSERELEMLTLLRKHPEKILPVEKLDGKIKPVSRRSPVFPTALRKSETGGQANIEVLINEDGRVCLPRIVDATHPAFGYAAAQAVLEWRFTPPVSGEKPAVARMVVPFFFKPSTPAHEPEIPVPETKTP